MKTIIESIHQKEWVIRGWEVHFLFAEKQLHQFKKLSSVDNWYEDPLVIDTSHDRLRTCFRSIQKFYSTFGILPQVGDRLFDKDAGMIVHERSIDADLMTISFTLTV